MYVTCYICQVGALSKAEDILEWNMGLVLTTARILFQRNVSRGAQLAYYQKFILSSSTSIPGERNAESC